MDEEMVVFALQVRAARALLGWKQSELAKRVGLAQPTVARIEKGTMIPRLSTVTRIRAAFKECGLEVIDNLPQGGFTLHVSRLTITTAFNLMKEMICSEGTE